MMRNAIPARAALALLLLAVGAAGAAPSFEPVPVPEHVYDGGWEHFVGGGVAVFDCDGDALPEIYAAGGAGPALLLRNGGGMAFAAQAGGPLALRGVIGAYPFDWDGDGLMDLYVLRAGPNALMRGMGGCGFAPVPGFEGGEAWSTAFSATWEGAGPPTLALGNYVDRADPEGPFGTCDANLLWRPVTGSYPPPLPLEPSHCALSMLFTDWDRTGRADLRVSNDRHYYARGGSEQMWAMEDEPRLYGIEDGWRDYALWGMGIASRDIDFDGLPEVYLTSMGDQRLQRRDGPGPAYADAPFEAGATAHRPHAGGDGRPSTGWHAVFGDVDADGLADLFVAKGNVEQMPGSAMRDPDSLLMGRPGGRFEEMSVEAGVAGMERGRGAALADLDLDGRLDLVVVNRRAPMRVYRNVTEGGASVSVTVTQPGPNRNAVGAWVELRANGRVQAQEITVGGGHTGGVAGPLHFGLGDASGGELRVIWPDGAVSDWRPIDAGPVAVEREG